MSINAVEGFPLEDFSIENVKSQISEAQKIVSGSGSEQDIAEAKIELEVRTRAKIFWGINANTFLGFGELASCPKVKETAGNGMGNSLDSGRVYHCVKMNP